MGNGTVFERDGKWFAEFSWSDPRTGKTRRARRSRSSRRAAQTALRELQRTHDAHGHIVSGRESLTVSDLVETWTTVTLQASSRKASTKDTYAILARNHLAARIGSKKVTKLRPIDVEAWLLGMKTDGLSESTVRQVYAVGCEVFDMAVREQVVTSNPIRAVDRPRVAKKEAACWTEEEARTILIVADELGSPYLELYWLLADTGLRIGEALALRWKDYEPETGLIRVTATLSESKRDGRQVWERSEPKTAAAERMAKVPDSEQLASVYRRQRSRKLELGPDWPDTGLIFTTSVGTPLDRRNVAKDLRRVLDHAGIDRGSLHTFRHYFLTNLARQGMPLAHLSKLAGHSDIRVTANTYGHITDDMAIQELDRIRKLRQSSQ